MKNLKKILSVFVLFVALVGISTVFASSYETTLELGPGAHVTGASRYYTRGLPAMSFTVKYYVKYNNQNCSRMLYRILGEDNYKYYEGTVDLPESIIGSNELLAPQGIILNAGNYKWYYDTKVNGTTYSGFYMNPVTLYTL